MFTNNAKSMSVVNNTITVTPIKIEDFSDEATYNATASSTGNITNKRFKYNNASTVSNTTAHTNSSGNLTSTLNTAVNSVATTPKAKRSAKAERLAAIKRPPPTLDTFWPNILQDVKALQSVDSKHQALPLARIKKIMKLDENAKMIAAEAPLLFAKACEFFIQELTMRAWIHTEENKRRTLQRSDIAQAIAFYDQFDFLIDIVPREDIKPSNHRKDNNNSSSNSNNTSSNFSQNTSSTQASNSNAASSSSSSATATQANASSVKADQSAEYITLSTITPEALVAAGGTATTVATSAQQQQQQTQPTQQLQIIQHAQPQQYFIAQQPQQLILTANPNNNATQLAGLNLLQQQPQHLILTTGPNGQLTATPAPSQQQTALLQKLAQQQQQQQQVQQQQAQIQLLQQVVSPTGEVTNVPISINASQLGLLQMQSQQQQQQQQQPQQVIIPAQCLTAQQLLQLGGAGNTATVLTAAQQPQQQAIFINAATGAPAQVQLQAQQSGERNVTASYRSC